MCRNYDSQLCKLQEEARRLCAEKDTLHGQFEDVVAGLKTAQQNLERKHLEHIQLTESHAQLQKQCEEMVQEVHQVSKRIVELEQELQTMQTLHNELKVRAPCCRNCSLPLVSFT